MDAQQERQDGSLQRSARVDPLRPSRLKEQTERQSGQKRNYHGEASQRKERCVRIFYETLVGSASLTSMASICLILVRDARCDGWEPDTQLHNYVEEGIHRAASPLDIPEFHPPPETTVWYIPCSLALGSLGSGIEGVMAGLIRPHQRVSPLHILRNLERVLLRYARPEYNLVWIPVDRLPIRASIKLGPTASKRDSQFAWSVIRRMDG